MKIHLVGNTLLHNNKYTCHLRQIYYYAEAEEASKKFWGLRGYYYLKSSLVTALFRVVIVILEYFKYTLSHFWRGSAPQKSKLGGFSPLSSPYTASATYT